jgi:hypothetical protein
MLPAAVGIVTNKTWAKRKASVSQSFPTNNNKLKNLTYLFKQAGINHYRRETFSPFLRITSGSVLSLYFNKDSNFKACT